MVQRQWPSAGRQVMLPLCPALTCPFASSCLRLRVKACSENSSSKSHFSITVALDFVFQGPSALQSSEEFVKMQIPRSYLRTNDLGIRFSCRKSGTAARIRPQACLIPGPFKFPSTLLTGKTEISCQKNQSFRRL